MHEIRIFILLIVIAAFSSCQFNQSVNKDLTTGAYAVGDGLGVEDIAIEIDGEIENRNEFVFGERVNLIFNNISGLTDIDGKTFPGLSMSIVKNGKDTVLYSPNILEHLNNGTDLSPLQLQANFATALANENNEKYTVFIEIWDRKGDGKLNYELPFTVKANDLLDIKNNGIEYSSIYLWDEILKQPVFDQNVSSENQYILIVNDLQGLELIDEKVFPIFSLAVTDNNGNKLLYNPNLLSAYEELGVDPENLKSQLSAKLTFTQGKIFNPCRLVAKLKDKNSPKEITISAELTIN